MYIQPYLRGQDEGNQYELVEIARVSNTLLDDAVIVENANARTTRQKIRFPYCNTSVDVFIP